MAVVVDDVTVMTPVDADKDMWNRYCKLRSTVLVHCKMHVSTF